MARAIGWWNFRSAAAAKPRISSGSQPSAVITRPTSGPLAGQRAGLVEQDSVDLVHHLERPPVLDQDALAGAQGQRAEHGERNGHADAGSEIAVEHRDRADGPHHGPTQSAGAQGRQHGLVGQPLSLVLRRHLVARRVAQDLADLGGRRLAPRHLDGHLDLAGYQQRRGKDLVAAPFSAGVDSPVKAC